MITKIKRIKKRSKSSLILGVFLAILVLIVVGFLAVSGFKVAKKKTQLSSRLESLKEELQALEEKRSRLQAQISQSLDEEYLEREARERFNLKKPGEEVVAVLMTEDEANGQKSEGKKWWNPFSW